MSDIMQNILIVSVIILASILAYQGFKFRELEEMTLDVFRTIYRKIIKVQEREEK